MNARVLELLKKPEQFLEEDFKIVEDEIKNAPYTQSIRALYLYGIKKHNPQHYEEELSKTAAYTTDKKILYQLINGKIEKPIIPIEKVETVLEIEEKTTSLKNEEEVKNSTEENTLDNTFIEENIEEEETQTIEKASIEEKEEATSSIENTIDETQSKERAEEIKEEEETTQETETEVEDLAKEEQNTTLVEMEIKEEPKIEVSENKTKDFDSEEETENKEISFHEQSNFMSEVKVSQSKTPTEKYVPTPAKLNRHEEERKRLLAEVEAKMKEKKEKPKEVEGKEITDNKEINFAETASFEVIKEENLEKQNTESHTAEEPIVEETPIQNTNWKPMSFSNNTPDALLNKDTSEEKAVETKSEIKKEPIVNTVEESTNDVEEEITDRPVLNVSFFSPEIKIISSEEEEKETIDVEEKREKALEKEEIRTEETSESNIPKFINTWQSWLKIDRTEKIQQEKEEKENFSKIEKKSVEKKIVSKNDVIEKFIQEEPKISKLKEDSEYVVKQSKEDISHLMTETLVKIYTEQKLYSKAIKGYKTLIEKHPEKEDYFLEKIEEINALKGN